MARRLNKKLVVGLTVAAMILTAGAAAVMMVAMPERDPEIVADRGRLLIANGETERGAQQLLRAAKLSGDPKYVVEAGDAYLAEGLADEARQLWQQAAARDPSNPEPQKRLVDLAMEMASLSGGRLRSWRDVQTQAETLLNLVPGDAKALHARGLALLRLVGDDAENEKRGLKDLQEAVKAAPNEPKYARDLAVQYMRAKQHSEAEAVFTNLLKAAPKNPQALQYYAAFLSDGNRDEEARAALNKAVEVAPDDAQAFDTLGQYWEQHNEQDKAQAAYRKAITLDPDSYPAYMHLGAMHMRAKHPTDALAVYKERLARGPLKRSGFKARFNRLAHFELLERAASALLAQAAGAEDKNAAESLLSQAERYVTDMVAELGENELTHAIRGRIASQRGRETEAIRELEQAVNGRPGWKPRAIDMTNLARLYVRQNQLGKAEETLIALTTRFPVGADPGDWTVQARTELAALQNRVNNPEQAIRTADQVLERHPNHRDAAYQKARALEMLARQASGARREDLQAQAAAVLSNLPKIEDKAAWRQSVTTNLLEGNAKAAEATLLTMLEKDPADEDALQSLVTIYMQTKRREEAARVVATAFKQNPDSRRIKQLQLATATDLSDEERQARQQELIESIEDPFTRAVTLAYYAIQRNAVDEARAHLDAAEAVKPDSIPVIQQQFLLAIRQLDWPRVERYVARCEALNIDGAQGLTFRGQVHLARAEQASKDKEMETVNAELEQAVAAFTQALELYPSNSMAQTWLGAAQRSLGNLAEAKAALAAALALNPNNGEAHLLSAQIAYAEGNDALGDQHLGEARRTYARDPRVRALLEQQAEKQNPQRAIERRERLRKKKPDDIANLTRLAELYLIQNQEAQALEVIEAARQLAPDRIGLVTHAARLLGRAGEVAKGGTILENWIAAQQNAETVSTGYVALAAYYRSHPEHYSADQVESAYKNAAARDESLSTCLAIAEWKRRGPNPADAVEWYTKAIAKADGKRQEHRLRIRATEGLYQAGLLEDAAEQARTLRKAFPDDVRASLLHAAIDLDRGRTDQALATVNEVLEKHPNNATAHYQRGVVHFRQSRYGPAIESLQRAKSAQPDGFGYQHRVLLARALELNGQLDLALSELEAIRRERPEATNAVVALIDTLARHDRLADVRPLVVEYTSRYPDDADWAYRRGQLELRLKNRAEAVRWLRKAAELASFAIPQTDTYLATLTEFGMWDALIRFATSELPEAQRNAGPVQRRLARAYAGKGNQSAAIEATDRALSEMATRDGLRVIASDLVAVHEASGARELVAAQVAARNGNRKWRMLHGVVLAVGGDAAAAIEELEALLSDATDAQETLALYQWLGTLWYTQKDFERARKAYEEVLGRKPDDRIALNNLAYLLAEDLKKPADALPHARHAVALAPQDANALDTLGWTQYLLDDVDGAIGTLLQAVQAGARSVPSHLHLGLAYQKNGNRSAAVRELELAIKLGREQSDTLFTPQAEEALRKLGRSP